jgi:hypothetical protein
MFGWTFWLPIFGAFVMGFAGAMLTAIAQAQMTNSSLSYLSYLAALMTALVLAVERGRAVWPVQRQGTR